LNSNAREFDLVIFGATGFTGGLVAKHVAAHARPELRVALAGRRADALNALRDRLIAAHPGRANIGVVVADVSEPASLERMAGCTRLVLSTVGPFVDYGEPVVSACVARGADYMDSTGEHAFVRDMIRRHGEAAHRHGVRLLFSCAFESIPTDLGVYYTLQQLPEGKPVDIVGHMAFRGVFSGGTERSAIKDIVAGRPGSDEYAWQHAGRSAKLQLGRVHKAPAVGAWVTPFDAIDPHIVLRSAAALERYGPRFTYTHLLVYPNLPALLGLSAGLGAAAFLARAAPLRKLMLKLAKQPGQGPTEAQMAAGWFRVRFDAQCEGERWTTEVSGGDPGYGATSMMLGQSALCLLEDGEALPGCSGVVTPAQVFGDRLIPRLQAHGMQFRVL
jgi:saccharopine dehydrogenase (NAD+, L-glutamate forming)